MSIFTVTDIDIYVIDHLDVKSMISLMQTNSYYYNTIADNKLYNVTKKFYQHKNIIDETYVSTYYPPVPPENDQLFIRACAHGQLDIVKYILSTYDTNIHAGDDQAFTVACQRGHLDICKFLCGIDGKINVSTHYYEIDKDAPFILACSNGKLDVVCWLYQNFKINIHEKSAFTRACEKGHLDVAEFLCKQGVDISSDGNKPLELACRRGHLNVVRWLCDFYYFSYLQSDILYELISSAAINNHVDIVKYFCDLYYDFDIHTHGNEIFRYCCMNNALESAVWIYERDPILVRQYIVDDELFKQVFYDYDCDVDVIKWSYSLGINIDIDNLDKTKLNMSNISRVEWLKEVGFHV